MSENKEQQKEIDQVAEKLAELFLHQIYQDLNFPKNKDVKNEQYER